MLYSVATKSCPFWELPKTFILSRCLTGLTRTNGMKTTPACSLHTFRACLREPSEMLKASFCSRSRWKQFFSTQLHRAWHFVLYIQSPLRKYFMFCHSKNQVAPGTLGSCTNSVFAFCHLRDPVTVFRGWWVCWQTLEFFIRCPLKGKLLELFRNFLDGFQRAIFSKSSFKNPWLCKACKLEKIIRQIDQPPRKLKSKPWQGLIVFSDTH